MKEIDRRTFLKIVGCATAAGVAGVAVGIFSSPIEVKADIAVNKAVGFYPPDFDFKFLPPCENNDHLRECLQDDIPPLTAGNFYAISLAPFHEEIIFRVLPSAYLSRKEDREDPVLDVLLGTGGIGMTRRELLVGAVSSVIFGASHTVGDIIINKVKRIPVSQTLSGMVAWYLQRKFGFGANVLAHSLNNLSGITQIQRMKR